MRKFWFTGAAIFSVVTASFSQSAAPADSAAFKSRKLTLEEVNFVSSYYVQDGNNSAVTGGIGTEELTDLSAVIDINVARTDRKGRIHGLNFNAGIDHYSSASSDKIDPSTISSASPADNRFYPSLTWSMQNEPKQFTVGAGVYLSTEYDYLSKGVNAKFTRFSKDHNREFGVGLSAFLDTWTIIYPVELRSVETPQGQMGNPDASGNKPRNSYNAAFTFAQVINKKMQFSLMLDLATQNGYLSTPYQRVYFQDNSVAVENLPDSRFKIPVGARLNYFATDRVVLRSFYRFYSDNWGISAHTAELEMPVKITPFVSVSPFYRFYSQTASDYFAGYQAHQKSEEFYTSDYDLSEFTSQFFGGNLRLNSASGVFGIPKLNTLELRYGYYRRSNGLVANSVTLAVTVK